MTTEGVRFFPADFSLEIQGETVPLRGLLSELGITKVTAIASLPEAWKEAHGKKYTVKIGSLEVQAVLVQHYDSGGTCSLIRFLPLEEGKLRQVQQLIESGGVSPGWQRKLPRISADSSDTELPLPSLCTVRFASQELYAEVLNFTIGGIGIKSVDSQMAEAKVGDDLKIDMITTRGDFISNFSARIMNISIFDSALHGGAPTALRYFGLKIIEMGPESKKVYLDLIRDHCLILQKRAK